MIEIQTQLFDLQNLQYKDFTAKLIPTVDKELIIGVPVPVIRTLVKKIVKEENELVASFVRTLPHHYHEENFLHVFLINQIKEFDSCCKAIEDFLPYVDNWATCDSLRPMSFKKNHQKLLPYIQKWINSSHTYTIRFGIECLMTYFLDTDFTEGYLEQVGRITSQEYYVKMMQAWYFATALAKQYSTTLAYLQKNTLEPWTHNKALQKAQESYRIPQEHKIVLRQMKRKI